MANPQPEPKRLDFQRSARDRRLRRDVFTRDDFTCQACGYRPPVIPDPGYDGRYAPGDYGLQARQPSDFELPHLHVDHVMPLCMGGAARSLDNLQTLCSRCNTRKAGADG